MKNATVASVNNKLGALEGLSIFRPTVLFSVVDVMKGESRRFFSSHRGETYSADGEENEEEGQGPERAADGEEVRQELRVERHIFQGEVVQTKSTALSFRQLGKEVRCFHSFFNLSPTTLTQCQQDVSGELHACLIEYRLSSWSCRGKRWQKQ